MLAGEARQVPADDDEECGSDSAGLDTVVYEFAEALLGSNIAKNDAVEKLALEGF
jgi:hypothetical protein